MELPGAHGTPDALRELTQDIAGWKFTALKPGESIGESKRPLRDSIFRNAEQICSSPLRGEVLIANRAKIHLYEDAGYSRLARHPRRANSAHKD